MTTATALPAVGDEYTYSVLVQQPISQFEQRSPFRANKELHEYRWVGEKFTPERRNVRICRIATGRCAECDGVREDRTSTVTEIVSYMDNSVEIHLADGTRVTAVVPHGDVCF